MQKKIKTWRKRHDFLSVPELSLLIPFQSMGILRIAPIFIEITWVEEKKFDEHLINASSLVLFTYLVKHLTHHLFVYDSLIYVLS